MECWDNTLGITLMLITDDDSCCRSMYKQRGHTYSTLCSSTPESLAAAAELLRTEREDRGENRKQGLGLTSAVHFQNL